MQVLEHLDSRRRVSTKKASWTKAGAARVETGIQRFGMLLLQGQAEIPSVADLLAGEPVTTRGFSWDYVPAWDYCDFLLQRPDIELVKLFRSKRTLVHQRLWPAVEALASTAKKTVNRKSDLEGHSKILRYVLAHPGISGTELKEVAEQRFSISGRRFPRIKNHLESWLCLLPFARTDVEYHTHDPAWFPWDFGKIHRSFTTGKHSVSPSEALETIGQAVPGLRTTRELVAIFPVAKLIVLDLAQP